MPKISITNSQIPQFYKVTYYYEPGDGYTLKSNDLISGWEFPISTIGYFCIERDLVGLSSSSITINSTYYESGKTITLSSEDDIILGLDGPFVKGYEITIRFQDPITLSTPELISNTFNLKRTFVLSPELISNTFNLARTFVYTPELKSYKFNLDRAFVYSPELKSYKFNLEPYKPYIMFYQNKSSNITVNKNIVSVFKLEGSFRDNISVTEPVFTIESTESPVIANYCYIPEFKRFYYITDINIIRTNLYEIHCQCDVLMSFRSDILSSSQFVSRNVNEFESDVQDNKLTVTKNYIYTIVEFEEDPLFIPTIGADTVLPYNIVATWVGGE